VSVERGDQFAHSVHWGATVQAGSDTASPAAAVAGEGEEEEAEPAPGGYFQGVVCSVGQRLSGRYLLANAEHVGSMCRINGASALAPSVAAHAPPPQVRPAQLTRTPRAQLTRTPRAQLQVVARCVCVTEGSLVGSRGAAAAGHAAAAVGTMLAVLPPDNLHLPPVRVVQFDGQQTKCE
jgi:hypothetical protein